MKNISNYRNLTKKAKLRLLRMHFESNIGHIGGNLSAIDAMLFIHHKLMQKDDIFILSKGHAAGALYVTLWTLGRLSERELQQFHGNGTKIAGHPVAGWHKDIPASTGSLGHGLSLAAGLAIGKRLRNERGRIFCFMSDGEWEEGSNWEALIFIAHHNLENLSVFIDYNGLQALGRTADVASLEPLCRKISAFGIDALEIEGHDFTELSRSLVPLPAGPNVFALKTIKGCGVSFMEGRMEWHYYPMTKDQYEKAIREIEQT